VTTAFLVALKGDRFIEWMINNKNRLLLGLSKFDTIVEALLPSSIGFGKGSLYINDALVIAVRVLLYRRLFSLFSLLTLFKVKKMPPVFLLCL